MSKDKNRKLAEAAAAEVLEAEQAHIHDLEADAVELEDLVDAEDGAETLPEDLLASLREELTIQADKYLRLMAEFDNLKRRHERDAEKIRELAGEKIINDLIDVRENFQRALAAPGSDIEKVVEGLQLISSKFDGCLANHGLSYFGDIGDEFNPEIHEAMMRQPHDEIDEDHVVQVFEKGYKLKSKVIRHAKVIVSAGKA